MPQIQLLDGKKISFTKSINGFELINKISKSLEKSALIMEVDGELKDLSHEITKDAKVKIITPEDKEGLEVIRHDASCLMTSKPSLSSGVIIFTFASLVISWLRSFSSPSTSIIKADFSRDLLILFINSNPFIDFVKEIFFPSNN